ncbi:MAG: hypothetical protein IKP46_05465 [Bacteroidales bacterium]|nr:hypothetical protein [Bacteroidales bacterium]
MKKYLIIFAAAALAAVGCNKESEYTPAPKEEGTRYYVSTEGNSFTLSPDTESLTFPVFRTDGSGAAKKTVYVTDESGLLFAERTAEVEFADGETKSGLTVEIDPDDFEYDVKYTVTLRIKDETTMYAPSETEFTIVYPAPWKSLGKARYRDGYVAGWYNIETLEYEVEIQENELYPGYYRLVNPYGAAFPYNEEGDYDTDQDYYMEIHAENPKGVWIPLHWSNMHWSDGYFYFGSLAGYYIEKGGSTVEAQIEAGNTGTLVDGVITFPVNGLLIAEENYNYPSLSPANSRGMFRIVFPGVELADYASSVEFIGLFNAKDGTLSATANYKLGPDVEYAKIAIAVGSDQDAFDEAYALAISDEESESVAKLEDKEGEVRLPLPDLDETYILVLVPFAGGEPLEEEAVYDMFQFKDFGIALTLGEPETDTDGNGHITASIEFGEDTEGALVVMVPGKDEAAFNSAIDLILDGDDSVVALEEPGDVTFDIEGEGDFMVVAVSVALGDLWNVDYDNFEYYAVDPWELLGTGALTDDVACGIYGLDPITVPCTIYENINSPGLYKITGFQLPIVNAAFEMDCTPYENVLWRNAPLVIDATNSSNVTIALQDYGVSFNTSEGFIDGVTSLYNGNPFSIGTLSDGVIAFPTVKGLLATIKGDGWYYANQHGAFAVYLPSALSGAPSIANKPLSNNVVNFNMRAVNKRIAMPMMVNKPSAKKVLKPAAASVARGKVAARGAGDKKTAKPVLRVNL